MLPVASADLPGALPVAATAVAILAVAILFSRRRSTGGAPAAAPGQGGKPIPSPYPLWSDLALDVTVKGDFPDAVKQHAQFGPVFWWRFLGRRLLMVGDYEASMRLLKGEHTIVEADYPPSVQHLVGKWGIANLASKQHMRIKRLVQAAFTPKAIRGYMPRMQAMAEEAVHKWTAQGDILAYNEMKWYTFRVAVSVIAGFDDSWTRPGPDGFEHVNALFKDWLDGLFSFPIAIPGTAFARGMKARGGLMQRINASLDLLEQQTQEKGQKGEAPTGQEAEEQAEQPTALDLLLASRDEEGKGLTREQICDNVLVMLFAGHDTSATSLTRIFHFLHLHPEAAERLRQEQAEVLAKHGAELTEEALADMPYTEGVIREVLRIKPIIAGFPRVALTDFELAGHTIPKGTRMQCSLAQPLLTDARWAGEADPLQFRPERWLDGAAHRTGAWIPFGGGPRLCLGWLLAMAEMKVLLAVVFRGHKMTVHHPDSPWALFPLARPKDGMPARLQAVRQQ
ncbi:hypothetical protein ABPG75_011799 [Micractinium tetrahymenae]